ncbi:MAG: hypothetical protein GY862_17980 [Gammaproteobacteria bacterium]|nr:hypothetical protein [Gammaproteobacteria bacterium]
MIQNHIAEAACGAGEALGKLAGRLHDGAVRKRHQASARLEEAVGAAALEGLKALPEEVLRFIGAFPPVPKSEAVKSAVDIYRALRVCQGGPDPARPEEGKQARLQQEKTRGGLPPTRVLLELNSRSQIHSSGREKALDDDIHADNLAGWQEEIGRYKDFPSLIRAIQAGITMRDLAVFGDNTGRMAGITVQMMITNGRVMIPISALMAQDHQEGRKKEGEGQGDEVNYLLGVIERAAGRSLQAVLGRELSRELIIDRCRPYRSSSSIEKAVDWICLNPVYTAKKLGDALELSQPGADSTCARLMETGQVEEITGGDSYRVYVAARLLPA